MLNSANDPAVQEASRQGVTITLAEDNIAAVREARRLTGQMLKHVAFHDYILHSPNANMDAALLNLLYQPANAWMYYAVQLAHYALRPEGRLYVVGAKDRGVLSVVKRMQEHFGNTETLKIKKGQRVVTAQKRDKGHSGGEESGLKFLQVFADSKLDEGTGLLLKALEIRENDNALDIGCGAGFVGLHIARHTRQGQVTMVDVSLAAVAASRQAVEESGLTNIRVLPSDGAQAISGQKFDLIATNPPFHQGGIQTSSIAERFIQESAQILSPEGRFYLVANRFLKYEPVLTACYREVKEVEGDTKFKVLRASEARENHQRSVVLQP